MCLRLQQTFGRIADARQWSKIPLIAPCDITVYKVLDTVIEKKVKEYYSTHRSTQYREGETKEVSKFSFKITSPYTRSGPWKLEINKGLHCFRKADSDAADLLLQRKGAVLIKCIIPKGTHYFKNEETWEYVSLKLQMPNKFEDISK